MTEKVFETSSKNSPLQGYLATFGFIPAWNKEAKPKLKPMNARAENVSISGFFNHLQEFIAKGKTIAMERI
jgi:putative SOS response-associated peptidase YedK